MAERTFEVGDQVRVISRTFTSGSAEAGAIIGIIKSIDKDRRRTAPYYIYYVEIPGEEMLIDFEYRELELVSATGGNLTKEI